MSYQVIPFPPQRLPVPPHIALHPLPSPPPSTRTALAGAVQRRGLSPQMKALLVAVVVVVVVLALLWWLDRLSQQREVQRNSRSPRRQSTAQMAKNLYERLQGRGGASDSAMRSLAQLARNA
jgi:hypothetical protein